jgi:diketogulonate reductase-like aldo/keto reductase
MWLKELGRTGVHIPEIGLGTWNYHAGPGPLRRGLEAGALFIDTAESYGTEPVVREAIDGLRNRVFLATKVSPQNYRRADLLRSVDASLGRLGVDVIDLLQLHEPNRAIPIQETLQTVADLIDAGKVRYAGVSNFSASQLDQARQALGRHPVVSNQVRYNLIDRTVEPDVLPYCRAHSVTVIAYCPLARGLDRIRDCDPTDVVGEIARTTGKSPAQVALNWVLCQEGVVAIPKGNSEQHVLDNCGASGWRLSPEQMALIESRIRYRRRTRLDELARRYLPRPLQAAVSRGVRFLPPALRRRVH